MYFLIVEDEFFLKHLHIFKTIKFDLLLNIIEMQAQGPVMSCLGVLYIGNLYTCMLYI